MSWSRTLKVRQSIRAQLEAGEEIAVLFSDIRGFSSYTAEMGDRAAYRLSQTHESILRDRIGEYGILVKSLGDGVMAAFETPLLAIQAAVGIQRAIRERNREAPDAPIDVGIGIAAGTPVMTDIDFIGHTVNLSQRLSSYAKGGQIVVTGRIHDAVTLPDDLYYIPLGMQSLKGTGFEQLVEVSWISERARVSDAKDRVTLILTERGTILVELAKDAKRPLREAIDELKTARADEDGAFSAALQRSIAWFTQLLVGASLAAFAIAREQEVDRVQVKSRRGNLVLESSGERLVLERPNPDRAREFLGAFRAVRDGKTS